MTPEAGPLPRWRDRAPGRLGRETVRRANLLLTYGPTLSKVEAQGVLGVPSGVRLGREDLVGGRPDRYSLQTGLDAV